MTLTLPCLALCDVASLSTWGMGVGDVSSFLPGSGQTSVQLASVDSTARPRPTDCQTWKVSSARLPFLAFACMENALPWPGFCIFWRHVIFFLNLCHLHLFYLSIYFNISWIPERLSACEDFWCPFFSRRFGVELKHTSLYIAWSFCVRVKAFREWVRGDNFYASGMYLIWRHSDHSKYFLILKWCDNGQK